MEKSADGVPTETTIKYFSMLKMNDFILQICASDI